MSLSLTSVPVQIWRFRRLSMSCWQLHVRARSGARVGNSYSLLISDEGLKTHFIRVGSLCPSFREVPPELAEWKFCGLWTHPCFLALKDPWKSQVRFVSPVSSQVRRAVLDSSWCSLSFGSWFDWRSFIKISLFVVSEWRIKSDGWGFLYCWSQHRGHINFWSSLCREQTQG